MKISKDRLEEFFQISFKSRNTLLSFSLQKTFLTPLTEIRVAVTVIAQTIIQASKLHGALMEVRYSSEKQFRNCRKCRNFWN